MKRNIFCRGLGILGLFGLWTWLVTAVDVRPAGSSGAAVGFAGINGWFHSLTGVHWGLYALTDLLGLVPLGICLFFAGLGFVQMLRRRSLRRVDRDILLLGLYYGAVVGLFLLFEAVPVNYRPVYIDGRLEASYPSSTTLLTVSVMPTLMLQAGRRLTHPALRRAVRIFAGLFAVFMVIGRTVCGVHWLTDILGGLLLGMGLFDLYRSQV